MENCPRKIVPPFPNPSPNPNPNLGGEIFSGGNLPSGNSVDLTEEFRELAEAIILKSKGTQKVVYSESSFIKAQAVPKCFV